MPDRERFQIGNYWLSQRPGRPQWCRTWFDPRTRQTRRESLHTESYETAKEKLAAWHALNGALKKESTSNIQLAALLSRYYEKYAINTASALPAYNAIQLLNRELPGITVAEFNHDAQTDFIARMRNGELTVPTQKGKKRKSDSYISRVMTVARAALNYAYKRGELATAPFVMSAGESPSRERRLSLAEMTELLGAVNSPVLAYFILWSLNTLSRPCAILELTHAQIDLDTGLVALNPAGRRQTKKYRPTVPLTDTLRRFYLADNGSKFVIGKQLLSIKKPFETAVKRAKLQGVTPYTLRHTMATELRARGVPQWELAGLMGHKIPGMTETYAKYDPNYLSNAKKAIDSYMSVLLAGLRVQCVFNALPQGGSDLLYLPSDSSEKARHAYVTGPFNLERVNGLEPST